MKKILATLGLAAALAGCGAPSGGGYPAEFQKAAATAPGVDPVGACLGRAANRIKALSTMLLGEISQTPRKDSMGMDMVPVFEDEAADSEKKKKKKKKKKKRSKRKK